MDVYLPNLIGTALADILGFFVNLAPGYILILILVFIVSLITANFDNVRLLLLRPRY